MPAFQASRLCGSSLVYCFLLLFFFPPSSFQAQLPPEPRIESLLQAARAAEQIKDFEAAAASYQEILRIRPQWALIHQSLGVVRHLQNRYPDAIAAFESALKLDPSLWGSHLFLGMDRYRTNQFQLAIPALQQSIKLNPKLAEPEARMWLGSSYLALEQHDEAVEHFRRLVELKPRDLEALFNLAQAYSRYSSALFKKISVFEPESAEAHRLQAEWLEWQEKSEEAIKEYQRVASLRPEWEGIHLSIAKLYQKTGELGKAAEALQEELRLAPEDPEVRQSLEAVQQKLGLSGDASSRIVQAGLEPSSRVEQALRKFRARDFAGARSLLDRFIAAAPKNFAALIYLSRCHFHLGDYSEAVRLLRREELQDHLEALYWAGRSYQELAAAALESMIDIDPAYHRVFQLSGELLEDKGKYSEAISAYQIALERSAESAGLRYAIGNAYWKMQKPDEALLSLKAELARNPYHALANYRIGSIYASKGDADLAASFLEKAIQANPGLLPAQQELAKVLLSQKRDAEAIAILKRLAIADPQDESVRYLLAGAYRKVGNLEAANAELRAFTQLRENNSRKRQEYLKGRVTAKP